MDTMIRVNIFRRDRVLVAGLSAVALILAAACSPGGGSAGGGGHAGASLAPRHILLAAATRAQQMTSATMLLTSQVSGIQSLTITGTIWFQRKPTLLIAGNIRLAAAGQSVHVREIITSTASYVSTPSLARQFGKPWVKIDLSALKSPSGATFAPLVRSLQNSNFTDQAELLTLAKNVRVVGTQTVGGVPTTEYACSLNAAQGRKAVPASFRKFLAPGLRALGNTTIRFHVWIDHQNRMRKATEVVTVNGETVRTTLTITALNQPVHITLPPASQTATTPGL